MIAIAPRFILMALLFIAGPACRLQAGQSAAESAGSAPGLTVLGQHKYQVRQRLTLTNEGPGQPEQQNVWVALIREFAPYQAVLAMQVSPRDYQLVTDEYGNRYAEFDFSNHPPGTTKTVEIDYQVVVNELAYELSACDGPLLDDFTRPELHIESANPQIIALAGTLSRGKKDVCEQVRAFYDYIGDELVYTYNGENWGAQAALGPMGADCTEYASLLVALSRSQGIPARYFEGLLFLDAETEPKAQIQHAWADVYLPGAGWVGMDPTLGRAPVDRATFFAHFTPEHIIVTMGASPSTLRGGSYWTHIYWPGNSTNIRVGPGEWEIKPLEP